jgi:hypothetical protein
MDKNNKLNEPGKLKITIDPRLNNIDVTKLFPESLERANRTLKDLRMPDRYYQQIIDLYNSQRIREALKENQSGKVLNQIVRELGANHLDGLHNLLNS